MRNEIKIVNFEPCHAEAVASLWNISAPAQGYAPLTEREFAFLLIENPYFSRDYAFVALDTDGVCGFVCGASGEALPGGAERGYFTCLLLRERADSDRNAGLLLDRLERAFAGTGRTACDVLFFNPMRLPWAIPGTPGHLHNNAPGVWVESPLYGRLLERGYVERSREQAYYLSLDGFVMPDWGERIEALARVGYGVALYDPGSHRGLGPMLEKLGNPQWEQEILASAKQGVPFLAAVKDNETVGFAGPIYPEKTGRGYFTGIGVVEEHGGKGLGSLLFYRLCEEERRAGAVYMSLFTGTNNPAGRIYAGAGFKPVREFAVMRKELKGLAPEP